MEEQNARQVTFLLNIDESVTISRDKKSSIPNYFRIGNGTMNKHKIQAINLVKASNACSSVGRWLIDRIMDGIGYDNDYCPVVKIVGTTTAERSYLKKGYKELHEKGLVKRVKRGHYMINPNALIPVDYEAALKIWNSVE